MISIQEINKSLGGTKIFQDLTFAIEPGQILCILGPSGSGKTTTLQMLAGLTLPDQGTITGLEDMRVSYVFQEPRLLPWKSVMANMDFVLKEKIPLPQRQEVIEHYLDLMSLTTYKNHYPNALSGGMKQRLSLCRSFAYPHDLLLMDEPFKSLDYPLRIGLVKEVLKLWQVKNNTIVFVTHDITEALLLGHRLVIYSAKPTFIRHQQNIGIPHQRRDLTSREMISLHQELSLLLQKEYEQERM